MILNNVGAMVTNTYRGGGSMQKVGGPAKHEKNFAFPFQLAGLALVASMCFALHCLLVSSQAPEYRLDSKPELVKNSHHITTKNLATCMCLVMSWL